MSERVWRGALSIVGYLTFLAACESDDAGSSGDATQGTSGATDSTQGMSANSSDPSVGMTDSMSSGASNAASGATPEDSVGNVVDPNADGESTSNTDDMAVPSDTSQGLPGAMGADDDSAIMDNG